MVVRRLQLLVERSADRVDGAVGGGLRVDGALVGAHPHLVAPVDPLLVRAVVGVDQLHLAGDHAHLGVGVRPDDAAHRVGVPDGVGVAHADDLAGRLPGRPVERRHLAAARADQQLHTAVGVALDDLVGAVARRVGRDDDLHQLPRVVQRQRVVQLALDHRLLVVGGDQERHRRQDVRSGNGTRPHAREQGDEQRVADVRPDDRPEAHPEHDLEQEDHIASVPAGSGAAVRSGARFGAYSAAPAMVSSTITKKYGKLIVR